MTKIEFFKKTSIWWVLPISFGMSLLGWCVYEPSSVPHKELGILGKLTQELVDNYPVLLQVTWYAAVAAHVGEAIYAYKLASKLVKHQVLGLITISFHRTLRNNSAKPGSSKLYSSATHRSCI